ncbi:hypothetical protein CC79DRAFT_1355180 [Sarocladium strictum]
MAFWVVRKGCVPDMLPPKEHETSYHYDGRHLMKRRGSDDSFDNDEPDHFLAKRARLDYLDQHPGVVLATEHHDVNHHRTHVYAHGGMVMATTHNPPFIIIREHNSSADLTAVAHDQNVLRPDITQIHLLNPQGPLSAPMERTASGHSISSSDSPPPEESPSLLSDLAAAQLVHKHLSTVNRHARHARILRALVYPKTSSRSREFVIDDDALESIFSAANDLFFANKLRSRVTWDWSHPDMASAGRYDRTIVGTTALRKRRGPRGGYETLIVLSSPILKDTKYNRRLLISTFLHEMIHSFLFVMCGRKAGKDGGHTEGFRKIAADIDAWVGRECLRLTDMEADLDRFMIEEQCDQNAPCRGGGTGAVTYTELDSQYHEPQFQQQHHNHHEQRPPYQQRWYSDGHHDEIETSPRYSSDSYGQHHHLPAPYAEHSGEGWQWQQREGFGAPRGAY